MQSGVYVKSIESIEEFRAALSVFGSEVDQSLDMVLAEVQRFVEWLEHDQLSFWKTEVRVREDHVAAAKIDLHRCLSATIDPNRTPSCYQEKKALDVAKLRLQEAEAKLVLVRRWIPLVRQAVFDFRLKIQPLQGALAEDIPQAIGSLRDSVSRLQQYLQLDAPTSAASTALSDAPPDATQASATLAASTERASPAAPPPNSAPAADRNDVEFRVLPAPDSTSRPSRTEPADGP